MSRQIFDLDQAELLRDRRACKRLRPHIEGSSGPGSRKLYAAFLDPTALVDWLAPAEMTGEYLR